MHFGGASRRDFNDFGMPFALFRVEQHGSLKGPKTLCLPEAGITGKNTSK